MLHFARFFIAIAATFSALSPSTHDVRQDTASS